MIFRNFVLQNFPFLEDDFDALIDYELFCKMVEYMKKSLEKVEGFQEEIDAFTIKLDDFQHYFDNLDVQEEINNKLDEMAESGELTDIIAQYLGLAGVLAYNNVSELANAENVANGSICKTLGFHNYNDGGGAYYKIRTITNEDTIDSVNIIAITHDNTLVAELIPASKMSVKCYGAYGDGTHDDTTALQNAIINHQFGTLYFDDGTYLISSPLQTYSNNDKTTNIIMERNTTIKTNENIDCIFYFGGLGGVNDSVINRQSYIKGGIINANNCNYGIKIDGNYYSGLNIFDLEINNFDVAGIYAPAGDELHSSILLIKNCYINGKTSAGTSVGIKLERPDNTIVDCNINACQKCITASQGGQIIRHVHGLGIGYTDNNDWFTGTVFFEMTGSEGNIIDECFCDTYQTFIKSTVNNDFGSFELVNSIYLSYINDAQCKIIDLAGRNTKFIIKNNQFIIPSASTNNQGLVIANYNSQITSKSNNNYVSDNLIKNPTKLIGGDLLLSTNKQYSPFWNHPERNISTTQWAKVGYITPNNYANYDFRFDFQSYIFTPSVTFYKNGGTVGFYLIQDTKNNNSKQIKLGAKSVGNVNGVDMYALYIQAVSADILECIQVKQNNENLPFVILSNDLMDITYETLTMDAEVTV